jgi:hypothetical protein
LRHHFPKGSFEMTKRALMGLVLPAIIGASAAFAQQPTMDKLKLQKWGNDSSSDRKMEVNPANKQISGAVVIPGIVDGRPVIVRNFYDCSQITSVNILEGATIIDSSTFKNCGLLTSITIPASVTNVSVDPFVGCNNLTSVTFRGANTKVSIMSTKTQYGDLVLKYSAGGAGTYTRARGGNTWTKQGDTKICPCCGRPL